MGELVTQEDRAEEVKPRHPGGRPTLYSDAVAQQIYDRIRRGVRPEAAAVAQGLHRDTFYAWMQEKEEFSDGIARADAEAEDKYTDVLYVAATDRDAPVDGKMAVEWLKRRRRAAYGDTLDVRKIDTAQLLELLQAQADTVPIYEAIEPGDDDL